MKHHLLKLIIQPQAAFPKKRIPSKFLPGFVYYFSRLLSVKQLKRTSHYEKFSSTVLRDPVVLPNEFNWSAVK